MNLEPWLVVAGRMSNQGLTRDNPPLQMIVRKNILFTTVPEEMAQIMKDLPDTRRVLFNQQLDQYLDDANREDAVYRNANDLYPNSVSGKWGLWHENGVEAMALKWGGDTDDNDAVDGWFKRFKDAGGLIDYLYSDNEGDNHILWDPDQYVYLQRPPLMNPFFWADQRSNPKWNTYEFFGKTMAQWLETIADPRTALEAGNIDDYNKRERHVGEVLDMIARRWWRRKMIYEPVLRHFPNCQISDYPEAQIDEPGEPGDTHDYPYSFWCPGGLAANVNHPANYFDRGRIDLGSNPDDLPIMADEFPWVIYGTNSIRSIVRSTNLPVIAEVAQKSLSPIGNNTVYIANTVYYDEAITHTILSQGQPNLFFFNVTTPTIPDADEVALNTIVVDVMENCEAAETIIPITKARIPYDSPFVVSAVYFNDTHRGVARVTFAPGEDTATFTLRGVSFTATAATSGDPGVWFHFNTILDIDNLDFDAANNLSFTQANLLRFSGANAYSFDEANTFTFEDANALPS